MTGRLSLDEDLASALTAALEVELKMDAPDARQTAAVVAAAFGGNEQVDDLSLPQDLRAIFYTLEKKRWLGFRRAEVRTEDGATRRVFSWTIRWDELHKTVEHANTCIVAVGQAHDVYETLPRATWRRPTA